MQTHKDKFMVIPLTHGLIAQVLASVEWQREADLFTTERDSNEVTTYMLSPASSPPNPTPALS